MMRKLGEGAMGLVMAAFDPDLERKVALKLLRGTMRDGSAGAARIRREAQAMARLSHPNVAQVYEVADDNGQLFLAMEYIEGATLREWLAAKPRPWREVLRVYAEAGRGLAAAHAAGLLHRDFKSDNAMLAADGRVRVLDFGLSRLHDAADAPAASNSEPQPLHLTNTGALVGTPAYMAPEQHKREDIDARSDQFSFCVALWEALYGQRPFAGATMTELVPNVLGGRIAAPPTETGVPAWVRTVLERGLAVEPALRWPTMDALLAALSHDPWSARRRLAVALGGVTRRRRGRRAGARGSGRFARAVRGRGRRRWSAGDVCAGSSYPRDLGSRSGRGLGGGMTTGLAASRWMVAVLTIAGSMELGPRSGPPAGAALAEVVRITTPTGPLSEPGHPALVAAPPGGDPERGAVSEAFARSSCHGKDGRGGALGPRLVLRPALADERSFQRVIAGGQRSMLPLPGVSEADAIDILAYLRALGRWAGRGERRPHG